MSAPESILQHAGHFWPDVISPAQQACEAALVISSRPGEAEELAQEHSAGEPGLTPTPPPLRFQAPRTFHLSLLGFDRGGRE